MRTFLLVTVLASLAVPAAAQDPAARDQARAAARERIQQAREAARERGQQAREAARERMQRSLAQETERTTRALKIGASGEIQISNISGDITITRGSGNEASVEIVKTARARTSEEARAMLQYVTVDVVERGSRAEIRPRYERADQGRENRRNVSVSVSFTIAAPAGTRVRAESMSGSISIRDITGELSLQSVSGAIRVASAGRIAGAQSISGNVEISESESDSRIEASSVSGGVVLRRVKARQIELGAISGTVVMEDVDSSRLEAQTVSGDLKFSGPLQQNGRYDFNSHSGGISVAIAGGTGFELDATSFSGSVHSDFPVPVQGSGPGPARGPRERSLRGVVGDGSAVLDVTTFSGSITISKR
jgi:DUF4097 and DUF4098 domain-containing protein YvlB